MSLQHRNSEVQRTANNMNHIAELTSQQMSLQQRNVAELKVTVNKEPQHRK